MRFLILGIVAALSLSHVAFAQDSPETSPPKTFRTLEKDEEGVGSGLRVSLGFYRISNGNQFVQSVIDYSGADTDGIAVKTDLLFFRPTRHEAGVGFYYAIKPSGDGSDIAIVGPYYRWRFASAGRAFYEINANYGRNTTKRAGVSNPNYFFGGSAIGYEFPGRVSLEYRYYYENEHENEVSSVMLGYRF